VNSISKLISIRPFLLEEMVHDHFVSWLKNPDCCIVSLALDCACQLQILFPERDLGYLQLVNNLVFSGQDMEPTCQSLMLDFLNGDFQMKIIQSPFDIF